MGLFDFALFPGQRFNKVELSILDQNFNSISAYTKINIAFILELLETIYYALKSVELIIMKLLTLT